MISEKLKNGMFGSLQCYKLIFSINFNRFFIHFNTTVHLTVDNYLWFSANFLDSFEEILVHKS